MLVQSFELLDGNRTWLAEGDIPDDQAQRLQVGDILPLVRLRANQQQIGSAPEGNQNSIPRGQYRIVERFDRMTENNTPFVELTLVQIS